VSAVVLDGSVSGMLLDGERLAHGILVNLSEAGARLVTDVGVPRGYLVRLKLYSMKRNVVDTRASIVWSAEDIERPLDILGTHQGVNFISASKREHREIEQLLRLFGWQKKIS
jgi:hypothetical protein